MGSNQLTFVPGFDPILLKFGEVRGLIKVVHVSNTTKAKSILPEKMLQERKKNKICQNCHE
jgi:hypothetical protein